jgi:hypothetical protein
MPTLHLGVIDQPYRSASYQYVGKTGKPQTRRRKAQVTARTTFDVAKILESKYHLMEVFYEAHAEDINQMVVDAYAGAVETAIMRGRFPTMDLGTTGIDKIRKGFNDYLDMEEMAALGVPGVPTQAAIHGVSHRFKHPYAKRARRPSFIDTGLYEASFMAWVD